MNRYYTKSKTHEWIDVDTENKVLFVGLSNFGLKIMNFIRDVEFPTADVPAGYFGERMETRTKEDIFHKKGDSVCVICGEDDYHILAPVEGLIHFNPEIVNDLRLLSDGNEDHHYHLFWMSYRGELELQGLIPEAEYKKHYNWKPLLD